MDSASRFATVRSVGTALQSAPRNSCNGARIESVSAELEVARFVARLRLDAFCVGPQMSPAVVKGIIALVDEACCYGGTDSAYGFRYRNNAAAHGRAGRDSSPVDCFFPDGFQSIILGVAATLWVCDAEDSRIGSRCISRVRCQ